MSSTDQAGARGALSYEKMARQDVSEVRVQPLSYLNLTSAILYDV